MIGIKKLSNKIPNKSYKVNTNEYTRYKKKMIIHTLYTKKKYIQKITM